MMEVRKAGSEQKLLRNDVWGKNYSHIKKCYNNQWD